MQKKYEVAIIGLGLMGGSMGLALKKSGIVSRVYGHDASPLHAKRALELSLVDETISLDEAIAKSVVVLAVPVDASISILSSIKSTQKSQTILDLGSTKRLISNAIDGEIRQNFVAAHPMTGTEYSGPDAAKEELYNGSTVVLCDLQKSGELQREIAKEIFSALGMKIIEMDSHQHDLHAAYISHLPHIISFSLANTVLANENPEDILSMAAGGFRDMSRLAKSRPDLWEQIFRQNRANLLSTIDEFEKNLSNFKMAIMEQNWELLRKMLEEGNKLHQIFK